MEFKQLKNIFFISRLQKNDSEKGLTGYPLVLGLAYDINKICDKDKRAVVERCNAGEYHNCEDTAILLGVKKRDVTLTESFESTMQKIKNRVKNDDTRALLVVPRDSEFLEVYLRKTVNQLKLKMKESNLPDLKYWQAWNLNLESGLVGIVGYTPEEIDSRTNYVQGEGHAACYHRDFVIDRDTKRKVCIQESFDADPYGMDDPQY